MFTAKKSVYIVGVIAFIGACSPPAPDPITPEPIYNKYGEATGCVAPDGTVTEVTGANYREQGRNPCEPEECVDGYTGTSQTPCQPYRGGDGGQRDSGGRGNTSVRN